MTRRRVTEVQPAPVQDADAAAIRADQAQQWADMTRAGWQR